jgi:hypothetical protein
MAARECGVVSWMALDGVIVGDIHLDHPSGHIGRDSYDIGLHRSLTGVGGTADCDLIGRACDVSRETWRNRLDGSWGLPLHSLRSRRSWTIISIGCDQ